ncbi:MAG: superoxide dismutase [Omnitrophica bacterium RIFCSPLOWO2_01_FULL_45_10]|nr:MAG: superoxide dismutase [Omnitrophica bacterium RIFCSPLOWO2_01_FULL_45_10]
MKENGLYVLPELAYDYKALEPHISEQQLRLHHDKHHQAYVNGANALLEKIKTARDSNAELDMKATARELSFNISGHLLHTLFWENLSSPAKTKPEPAGAIKEMLSKEFGSFERFKGEFTKAAVTVEGSGWAVLTYCNMINRPIIMQVEKHNLYVAPSFPILLVLDVWEHAYYVDYKNERAKFVEAFWNIVNWDGVNDRIKKNSECVLEMKTVR